MSTVGQTQAWIEGFPWESEEQKKGFLALFQWLKGLPEPITDEAFIPAAIAAWFIQKDHESNVWWGKIVGDQVSALQDQLRLQQRQIEELKSLVAEVLKT